MLPVSMGGCRCADAGRHGVIRKGDQPQARTAHSTYVVSCGRLADHMIVFLMTCTPAVGDRM